MCAQVFLVSFGFHFMHFHFIASFCPLLFILLRFDTYFPVVVKTKQSVLCYKNVVSIWTIALSNQIHIAQPWSMLTLQYPCVPHGYCPSLKSDSAIFRRFLPILWHYNRIDKDSPFVVRCHGNRFICKSNGHAHFTSHFNIWSLLFSFLSLFLDFLHLWFNFWINSKQREKKTKILTTAKRLQRISCYGYIDFSLFINLALYMR